MHSLNAFEQIDIQNQLKIANDYIIVLRDRLHQSELDLIRSSKRCEKLQNELDNIKASKMMADYMKPNRQLLD